MFSPKSLAIFIGHYRARHYLDCHTGRQDLDLITNLGVSAQEVFDTPVA